MKRIWRTQRHSTIDKCFRIFGPNDFELIVDFDDVCHTEVNRTAKKIVKILNDNWELEEIIK